MEQKQFPKTSLGLQENVEATLCYVLGWLSGLIFLLLEKDNKNVKFHAMQSLVVFLGLQILSFILMMAHLYIFGPIFMIGGVILWVFLMVKAYQGEKLKLPVVGDFSENFAQKGELKFPAQAVKQTPPPSEAAPIGAKKIFCTNCGKEATAQDRFCEQCGTPIGPVVAAVENAAPSAPTGNKEALLQAVEHELAEHPQLAVSRSTQTDLEVKSVLADANWGVGKKKIEYSACLRAKEDERIVIYWEMIKERGAGMEAIGGFKVEGFKVGKAISGVRKEVVIGPDGKKIVDYSWDYGKTRGLVERIAKANGWKFKVVLMKNKAMY